MAFSAAFLAAVLPLLAAAAPVDPTAVVGPPLAQPATTKAPITIVDKCTDLGFECPRATHTPTTIFDTCSDLGIECPKPPRTDPHPGPLYHSPTNVPVVERSQPANTGPFGLIVAHSGSPIHLSTINANHNMFLVGKPTNAFCPPEVARVVNDQGKNVCDSVRNVTAIDVNGLRAGMDTVVPGGQQIYLNEDGALSFTTAHTHALGEKDLDFGFHYEKADNAQYGTFKFQGVPWFACPKAGVEQFQIYANREGARSMDGCLDISINAVDSPNPEGKGAWQYN